MSIPQMPRRTLADYAAIAVCPVLVMLVVGSLVFFLLAIGYSGSHLNELRWTFFWFVLAMVLVSRIAIERGSDYAWVYGFCLAAATAFMLLQYVDINLWMWFLLGLIWWATNKLTWDTTVIDEDQDASGEGLLQVAKLDGREKIEAQASEGPVPAPFESGRTAPAKRKTASAPAAARGVGKPSAKAKRPHAPGLWIIYFSLGALPVFGLGQGLIAGQDAGAQLYVFCLLATYCGAALGLLLITSFLGLRRYLRQRYLQMPASMTASWLTTGAAIAASILIGSMLLPRPSAHWSLTAMIDRIGDPVPKKVERQTTTPKSGSQAPDGEASRGGEESETTTVGDPNVPDGQQADAKQDTPNDQGPPAAAQPSPKPSPQTPLNLLKLAIYALLVTLGLLVMIKNRQRLGRLLLEFWRTLLEFWRSLFGRKAAVAEGDSPAAAANPPRPFSYFRNPFASGEAAGMSPEELVIYSFSGLEAWAAEHGFARPSDQTPFEFVDRVAAEASDLATEARELARWYAQVAYGRATPLPACQMTLEILWSKLDLNIP